MRLKHFLTPNDSFSGIRASMILIPTKYRSKLQNALERHRKNRNPFWDCGFGGASKNEKMVEAHFGLNQNIHLNLGIRVYESIC